MTDILVTSDDEDVLVAAIKKHGSGSVWWKVTNDVEHRMVADRCKLSTFNIVPDATDADFTVYSKPVVAKKPAAKKVKADAK